MEGDSLYEKRFVLVSFKAIFPRIASILRRVVVILLDGDTSRGPEQPLRSRKAVDAVACPGPTDSQGSYELKKRQTTLVVNVTRHFYKLLQSTFISFVFELFGISNPEVSACQKV